MQKPPFLPREKRTVLSTTGAYDLCAAPDGLFDACGLTLAPIRLLNGVEGRNGGFGNAHIEAHEQRMKMIAGLGFKSPRQFLATVLSDIDYAAVQDDGRLVLIAEAYGYYHHVVCQHDEEIGVWSVTTVVPKRHMRGIKPLWEKENSRPDESEPRL